MGGQGRGDVCRVIPTQGSRTQSSVDVDYGECRLERRKMLAGIQQLPREKQGHSLGTGRQAHGGHGTGTGKSICCPFLWLSRGWPCSILYCDIWEGCHQCV